MLPSVSVLYHINMSITFQKKKISNDTHLRNNWIWRAFLKAKG